jgi:antitoxin YefM
MKAMTYSKVRANFSNTMDFVCDNHDSVIITRNGDQSVVLISLEDYQSLEETAYLLKNPANARRLLESVQELEAGDGVEHNLTI